MLVLFGTFDPAMPRTRLLAAGWEALGGDVRALHVPVWPTGHARSRLSLHGDRLGTAARWLGAQAGLWRRRADAGGARAILVAYPGHLDMPLARRVARRLGLPLLFDPFISLHDTTIVDRALNAPGSPTALATRGLDRSALRLADLVLADTEADAAFFRTLAGLAEARTAVVPVGADETLFAPREPGPADGVEVLFYGHMIPLHGVEVILEAARRLEGEPGLRFHLVGTGQFPIEARLAAAPRPNLRWTADVPYEQLPALLAEASICLGVFGTSEKAGRVIPHKVFEAAAMGRAIITRDGPAMRAGFGDAVVAVPPGDAAALADAIRALAADPGRRAALGAAALARTRGSYDRLGVGRALLRAVEAAERS